MCGSQGKGRLERGTESFLGGGDVLCLSWHRCHTWAYAFFPRRLIRS